MGLKWIKQTAGNYASKCGRFHIRKIRDSRKWGRTWTLTKLPQEPDELEVWQEFSTLAKCKDAADARVEVEDNTVDACPICGAEIQSTTEVWRSGVTLSADCRIVKSPGVYVGEEDFPSVYCANDHTRTDMLAVLGTQQETD